MTSPGTTPLDVTPPAPNQLGMAPWGAKALVFFTSAAVLVLETLAGRLMAPYVGVTLETFTGIIGTVLAGIALGAWLGGRAADQFPPQRIIGPALIVGGILTLLSPAIITIVGPALRGGKPLDIVLLTSLGFFLPAVVLSAVSPIVVKIQLHDLAETGAVVGRLSAMGTAGAIFGTFVTGFVLLAAMPSRPIVMAVGGALILVGVILGIRGGRLNGGATAGLLAVGFVAGALNIAAPGPCEIETAYFCAQVTVDETRASGRILWLDTLRHSYVDLEDPTYLEFRYANIIDDAVATQTEGPLDALYVGGGGFTLPRWLNEIRPGSTNTVLELDDELVDIAVDDLGLDVDEIDRIEVGDARLTLNALDDQAFTLVVGDAFGGQSVPWHLTTKEFLESVESRMDDSGIYAMNLIDYQPLGFAKAETATLLDVFDHVMVIAPFDYFEGPRGGNFVLVASNSPLDAEAMEDALLARGGEETVRTGEELVTWVGDARVLIDDFAPVDQLISGP